MRLLLAVIASSLLLASCATEYQTRGLTGGFSETQLAPDTFEVRFNGNGFTSPERASDFALLRAADLTLQAGYTHFVIERENETVSHTRAYLPTTSQTHFNATNYGGYVSGNATTTTYGGGPIDIFKPGTRLLIHCLRTVPDGVQAFDAAFLRNSIRAKYQMKDNK